MWLLIFKGFKKVSGAELAILWSGILGVKDEAGCAANNFLSNKRKIFYDISLVDINPS